MKKKTKESSIPATLSISRIQNADGSPSVCLRIRDKRSRTQFVVADIAMVDFSNALFGLAEVPIRIKVQGLRFVGKYKEAEQVSVKLSRAELRKAKLSSCSKEQLEAYLTENYQREGWYLNPYLGSQSSAVGDAHGGVTLNFSYYRYNKTF